MTTHRIERLNENNLSNVYCCLGERQELFKDDISDSLGYMKEKLKSGWLAYAVYGEGSTPIGMAILVPSSDPLSPVKGEDIYYFHCLDINKNLRKQGIGRKLIEQITEDVKTIGGKGLAVDCFGEYWMPCSYFTKIGFEAVKKFPNHSLLLKKITRDAKVEFIEMSYRGDLPQSGIQIDIQHMSTCPFILNNFHKVPELVKRIEPEAVIHERVIDTGADIEQWGGSGVYVNGKSVAPGPVNEEDLKKAIEAAKK